MTPFRSGLKAIFNFRWEAFVVSWRIDLRGSLIAACKKKKKKKCLGDTKVDNSTTLGHLEVFLLNVTLWIVHLALFYSLFFVHYLSKESLFFFFFPPLILHDVWVPGRLISQKKVLNHTYAATSQNRGRTSPTCRYDSWKRGPTAFFCLAPRSTQPPPMGAEELRWRWMMIAFTSWCFSHFFYFFFPRFLTRWQGCHPWGRARSFASLMNMRTISNKCHRCPNCQIYSQLEKKIPSAGLFLFSCFFVTQPLVCKIACSPAQNLGNYKPRQWKQPGT